MDIACIISRETRGKAAPRKTYHLKATLPDRRMRYGVHSEKGMPFRQLFLGFQACFLLFLQK